MARTLQTLNISKLFLNLENPRFDPIKHQRQAFTNQLEDPYGEKLITLAEDIQTFGINPTKIPIVLKQQTQVDAYVVLEGNRRIAATKLLIDPLVLSSLQVKPSYQKRIERISQNINKAALSEVMCIVYDEFDAEARHWIELEHTGLNGGAGIYEWDGKARARFRGGSVGFQAIDLVLNRVVLTDEERGAIMNPRIKVSTIDRLLEATPEARKVLGLDIVKDFLVPAGNELLALSCLTQVVLDIAQRRENSRTLHNKADRVQYAERISKNSIPRHLKADTSELSSSTPTTPSGGNNTKKKSTNQDRKTLAPRPLKLAITHPRISDIYKELQKLELDKSKNACAVLFRVFIELSLDEFGRTNKITLTVPQSSKPGERSKVKDMTLLQKLSGVAKYMEEQDICSKHELKEVRMAVNDPSAIFSTETLNAYVHNVNYAPKSDNLIIAWNNMQRFIEALWP